MAPIYDLRFTIYDLDVSALRAGSGAGTQRNFWNKARNRLERCRRSQAAEASTYDLQSPRGLGVGLDKMREHFARRVKTADGCKAG